ncbi:MAG: hypothetical protein IT383_28795 [Deltaproteobacteria bacterium]|nr:hypothetical protein [Deltaproteobacteria bacterium]
MATAFVPARAQDASPTIRGFVYQANLSLLRWLNLNDGGALELECGEDIDHVARTLVGVGPAEPLREVEQRLLEQIKHLDRNVTLRTTAVLKALAAFHAQRAKNTSLALSCRFTTNAKDGVERPRAIRKAAVSGIALWKALRTNA